MKAYLTVALGAVLLLFGSCQSTSFFGEERIEGTAAESVRIFVNGEDRGVTPMTLRVYRYRKELDIALRQGRETVRSYRIEETASPNSSELIYSFRGNDRAGVLTFNTEDLPTKDKKLYIIPYVDDQLTIEDNKYALTLIVLN